MLWILNRLLAVTSLLFICTTSLCAQGIGFSIIDNISNTAVCIELGETRVRIKPYNEKEIEAVLTDINNQILILKPVESTSTKEIQLDVNLIEWIRFENDQHISPIIPSVLLGTASSAMAFMSVYAIAIYPNPLLVLLIIPNYVNYLAIKPILKITHAKYIKKYHMDRYTIQRIGVRLN